MIDLDKLPQGHIDALLYSNSVFPPNVAALMPVTSRGMNARLDDIEFAEGEEHSKKSLEAVKDILAQKKKLFNETYKKSLFSKPEGEKELMAAYDAAAKEVMSRNREFATAVKQDGVNAERLIEALKGINSEAASDIGRVIAQSIELSYFKDKPFAEMLGKRMKELGMVTKKQAKEVEKIVAAYESGDYGHLLKPVAKEALALEPQYETAKPIESPKVSESVVDSVKTAETVSDDSKGFMGRIAAMSKGKKWALGGAGVAAAAVGGWVAHENNKRDANIQGAERN